MPPTTLSEEAQANCVSNLVAAFQAEPCLKKFTLMTSSSFTFKQSKAHIEFVLHVPADFNKEGCGQAASFKIQIKRPARSSLIELMITPRLEWVALNNGEQVVISTIAKAVSEKCIITGMSLRNSEVGSVLTFPLRAAMTRFIAQIHKNEEKLLQCPLPARNIVRRVNELLVQDEQAFYNPYEIHALKRQAYCRLY